MKRLGTRGVVRGAAALCFAMGTAVMSAQAQGAESKAPDAAAVRVLLVSDIHFEPFWDPAKVARLKAAPVSQWKAILEKPDAADREGKFAELQQTCHARGEDTSEALLDSSVTAIHAQAADVKFVMVSGDLMAHAFNCKYATLFPKTLPGEYRAFAEKTLNYVTSRLREALPGVPVYAALGNNDSDCGDYQLDANGRFLKAEANEFTRGFSPADRPAAEQTFAAGGYYSVKLPTPMERARLLVLDDVFFSKKYATCGGNTDAAESETQIAWLEKELVDARKIHEKVWVMAHIPPGVDPYSTAAKGPALCAGKPATMFLSSEALPEALAKYGDVIRLAVFAHTHMDEVRWLAPAGENAGQGVAVKMVPSISPINGNLPAFTVATIDAQTAVVKDYRVIAASNKTGADATWAEEYDFAEAYKEPEFSAATVKDLIGQLESDRAAQTDASQNYIRSYDVGQPVRELGPLWPAYVCALKNDTGAAFTKCLCGE